MAVLSVVEMVDALVSKTAARLDDCLVDHLAARWVWRMADSMVG